MAFIKVNNATVKKIFSSSFVIAEKVEIPGFTPFDKNYTVWYKGDFPKVGDKVNITGRLSMKIFEYGDNKKNLIDVSINDPEIVIVEEMETVTKEETENTEKGENEKAPQIFNP